MRLQVFQQHSTGFEERAAALRRWTNAHTRHAPQSPRSPFEFHDSLTLTPRNVIPGAAQLRADMRILGRLDAASELVKAGSGSLDAVLRQQARRHVKNAEALLLQAEAPRSPIHAAAYNPNLYRVIGALEQIHEIYRRPSLAPSLSFAIARLEILRFALHDPRYARRFIRRYDIGAPRQASEHVKTLVEPLRNLPVAPAPAQTA